MNKHAITAQPISPIPPDDLQRNLVVAGPNEDQSLPHIALMGDTYTILLSGDDTDGRYCLIDMMLPPAGQEDFFAQVGVAVATRTTRAPKLDEAAQTEFIKKAQELAPKYRTELLKPSSELPPDSMSPPCAVTSDRDC